MLFELAMLAIGLIVMMVAFYQIVFSRSSETVYQHALAEAGQDDATMDHLVPE